MSDFLKKVSSALGGEGGDLSLAGLKDQVLSNCGGLKGLVDQFSKQGLGDVVNSWVGKGANLAITPDQIQQGIGLEKLTAMAEKLGIPVATLKDKLAQFLPQAVDQATPDGKIAE